ncbi:unnamed protein product [Ectocarpus sp. CCAP 1310/34]|nr:unnamed protein product [Ectocarpus sp. CCAP 1310/34]
MVSSIKDSTETQSQANMREFIAT